MKWPIRFTLILLFGIVLSYSTIYFFTHIGVPGFQEAAMGNLLATTIGAIIGIPIALEINQYQQRVQTADAHEQKLRDEKKRKKNVLTLLKTELEQSRGSIIEMRIPIEQGGDRTVSTIPLNDEIWGAFSDSGELHYIDNPNVVAAIANAYHYIRSIVFLERAYLEVLHYPGMQIKQPKFPRDYFRDYLSNNDPYALDAINNAIQKIDAKLDDSTSALNAHKTKMAAAT